jgi:hypothetical protein
MPNGDTAMQYPFPYKNSANDISISPNATFNIFDVIDLIVQNNASVGGTLTASNVVITSSFNATNGNFLQSINGTQAVNIRNTGVGNLVTSEIQVENPTGNKAILGIGAVTNATRLGKAYLETDGAGLDIKSLTGDINIAVGGSVFTTYSTSGVNFPNSMKFSGLSPSTVLFLDPSNIVTGLGTTGTGSVVRSAGPTFSGTAQFASLTASTPIDRASGGTGLGAVGTNGQFLSLVAGNLAYVNLPVATLIGGTNITITGGNTINVSGVIATTLGGTGLSTVGSLDTFLRSNGSVLSYVPLPVTNVLGGTNITVTGSPAKTVNLSGIVPTTLGGTGLGTIGLANQVLRTNGAATALEYSTPTVYVSAVGLAVPAAFTSSGGPITTSGTLTLGYSGSAIPVLNGGTGTTTSTGTGSVVLNNTPTLISPSLGAANATSLSISPLGIGNTIPLTIYQGLLAVNNRTTYDIGVSGAQKFSYSYVNTASPTLNMGFNGVDSFSFNTLGQITPLLNTGGFAGATNNTNPVGMIGEVFGTATGPAGGTTYQFTSTTNPPTSPIPALSLFSISLNQGLYLIIFQGVCTFSNANGRLQITQAIGITFGNLRVLDYDVQKANAPMYTEHTMVVRINSAGTTFQIRGQLSNGNASAASWFLGVTRIG